MSILHYLYTLFTILTPPTHPPYLQMNEVTQTNFTLTVTIPSTPSEHAVLRLRYVSQNPTENDRGTT
ncbi:hypothetical protein EON65_49520, partial [archaeon]